MNTTRSSYSPDFKVKVAIEALSGGKTLVNIAENYNINPKMVANWREKLYISGINEFSRGIYHQNSIYDTLIEKDNIINSLKAQIEAQKKFQ